MKTAAILFILFLNLSIYLTQFIPRSAQEITVVQRIEMEARKPRVSMAVLVDGSQELSL